MGITDIAAGADLGMAGKLGQLKNAVQQKTVVLQQVEQSLQNLKLLQDTTGLPTVPDVQIIQNQAANLQGLVNTKLQDLRSLPGGACLDGALNSVASIANEGYSFVSEQMNELINLAGVPADIMNISGLYSQTRDFTKSLGIEQYVGAALDTMGCLADDTLATAELDSLMGVLGVDGGTGEITDSEFQASMMADLTDKVQNALPSDPWFGLDVSYITNAGDAMGEITNQANVFAEQAKAEAAAVVAENKQAIKDAVAKIPTPPSIF